MAQIVRLSKVPTRKVQPLVGLLRAKNNCVNRFTRIRRQINTE